MGMSSPMFRFTMVGFYSPLECQITGPQTEERLVLSSSWRLEDDALADAWAFESQENHGEFRREKLGAWQSL